MCVKATNKNSRLLIIITCTSCKSTRTRTFPLAPPFFPPQEAAPQQEEDEVAGRRRDEERMVEEGRKQNKETLAIHFGGGGVAVDAEDDSDTCVICLDNKRNTVLLPCKHLCVCKACAGPTLKECPMCRQEIHDSMRVYT
ncbi:hypothetical protein TrCOL_g2027 [Triparma columacea]|uniref:RING-type domain-containing protein n=1 Tax=Triparma columacea TaxID=722753 RepID=A0A9W7GB90_9STRA|nr:hypothetical protein TrCOL_g2027 [Triparma columacea]